MTSTVRTGGITALASVAIFAAVSPPPAHADDDDLYIASLNHVGAGTSRAPRDTLIHLGHTVCSDLSSGRTADAEMKGMFATADLTVEQAAMIVTAAINFYCPQYKGELS
jgi:Protein of unknown function (DUF732)